MESCQAALMSPERHPQAWLLLAAGDSRQHGGNLGYDDQADVYYTWDSTVNNHSNVRVGDAIAIWDKRRLLGVSVIEDITATATEKLIRRCPSPTCGKSSIKERTTKEPRFRCQVCRLEFDEPDTEVVQVMEYRSRHDAAWSSLEDVLSGEHLRALCESPKSQLSMRALDWGRFKDAVEDRGAESAVERVLGRMLGVDPAEPDSEGWRSPQGHTKAVVRVRRGQGAFRKQLLSTYGSACAFTGTAPDRVLEAGHLYSYAKLGEHHLHGGLLLRRDVHRLFDDGWLAVDPGTLKVNVSQELGAYPQYSRLDGSQLHVDLKDKQVEWLEKHWAEHRS